LVKALFAIHRWTGAFIGLVLAILGLTGAILVWEGAWIGVPGARDPLVENAAAIGAIVDHAAAQGRLSRVTFADNDIGLHQLTYADGSGAYVTQGGQVVDHWTSQWERPELWLFDLHHHLFAGESGETVTGIAGLAGLLFVVTGTVLWWRSRRAFQFRLWPTRVAPGPIVAQHRDLGIVVAPLLLLSLSTGMLMVFDPLRAAVIGKEVRPKATVLQEAGSTSARTMLEIAKQRFPDAELRRIGFPQKSGKPILVRLRQPAEWTPNGRTQLSFDSRTGVLLSIEDPLRGNRAAAISEKLYPLHAATTGGLATKLLMTISGLGLFLLGSLTTYGFWARKLGRFR
jgi:uncharacterized iron-regulated membrane protein